MRDVDRSDLLDQKIEADRRLWRVVAMLLAPSLAMTWFEIQRRLSNLNHEHERIEKNQSESVSHDTYAANESKRDEERKRLDDWQRGVNETLTKSISRDEVEKTVKEDKQTNLGLYVAAAAIFVTLASFSANYLTRAEPAPVIIQTPTTATTPKPAP